MPDAYLGVPLELRRGALKNDEEKSIESGRRLIELMCRRLGTKDLASARLLDMGCGVKLTQAFLSMDLPIGEYVGIDVYAEMIEYLRANVQDPRFSFHSIDVHNAMYNPDGVPLSAGTRLPVEEAYFDYICLFSVFTHLAPHDFDAMLKLLRPYIKPGGRMIFSAFLHEHTEGGHGFVDKFARKLAEKNVELEAPPAPPDFVDFDPKNPLKVAIYSRQYAIDLFEGSGWEIESINDPLEYIQHHFVCKPV